MHHESSSLMADTGVSLVVCPICQGNDCTLWSSRKWTIPSLPKEYRYLVCEHCAAIFCDPMPTPEDLARYYARHFNYDWYERRRSLKRLQALQRWKRMERLFLEHGIKPGALLDIGCGHGLFVDTACHSGWVATGLDYPSAATEFARNRLRLNIVEGDLAVAVESGKIGGAKFDFITVWHCLEHSSTPVQFLSNTTRLLKPGGKLLLAVPNAEGEGMRKARENWVWCQEPFVHVVHYNGRNLSHAARSAGLNVISHWSRDTWDANCPFDDVVEPVIRKVSRRASQISSKMAFALEEGSRLFFYLFFCVDHWLLGRECKNQDGSELLLLAERPRED